MTIERVCRVCGKTSTLEVDADKYERWRTGELAQKVFPEMSADEREVLISGTHPACWDRLFSKEEE
jgi:hypothetical protein